MTTNTGTGSSRVFLVGIDFSELGDAAFLEAMEVARLQGAGVHVVHVVPTRAAMNVGDTLIVSQPDIENVDQRLSDHIESLLDSFGRETLRAVTPHLRVGDPAREIARLAEQLAAETIFVGTHGRRGVARIVLGSVAERVLRHADCPVRVVRAGPRRCNVDVTRDSAGE